MRHTLALALTLCAAAAYAQNPATEAEHQRGVQLRAQGQNAEAAEVFRAIFERTGEPRALARLGLAEGALSRWTDADEHLTTALARASDPWITANRASLEQALTAVRTHLGSSDDRLRDPGRDRAGRQRAAAAPPPVAPAAGHHGLRRRRGARPGSPPPRAPRRRAHGRGPHSRRGHPHP